MVRHTEYSCPVCHKKHSVKVPQSFEENNEFDIKCANCKNEIFGIVHLDGSVIAALSKIGPKTAVLYSSTIVK